MSYVQDYLDESLWEAYDKLSPEAKNFCFLICQTAHRAGFDLAISRVTQGNMRLRMEYREDYDA